MNKGARWAISFAGLIFLALLAAGCSSSRPSSPTVTQARQTLSLRGSTTLQPMCRAWGNAYMMDHPEVKVEVEGGGSNVGIDSLVMGLCDIATSSQKINAEQLMAARKKNRRIDEAVVGFAIYAVVVNPANTLEKLTQQQISDIFTRQITNWKQVGGSDTPINVIYRDIGPGQYDHFLETVVNISQVKDPGAFITQAKILPTPEEIRSAVATDPAAIGYLFLNDLDGTVKPLKVAALSGQAFLKPNVNNALYGGYPILRPLYFYSDASTSNTQVAEFLEFVRSRKAADIAVSMNMVPFPREGLMPPPGRIPSAPRFNP